MCERNIEQQINIRFYVYIGKSASKKLTLLKMTNAEHAIKKFCIFEWHGHFKEEQKDVHNKSRSGQPKTQRTDADEDKI